jgi:hypothetical protein
MALELNRAAFDQAAELIWDGHYRLNVNWHEASPSVAAEDTFIAEHGWTEFANWYLIIDTTWKENTKMRYHYPLGNYRTVIREGVLAARDYAAKAGLADIEDAAETLLGLFDKLNAC